MFAIFAFPCSYLISIVLCFSITLDGQRCVNNPDINQRANTIENGRQVIVPNFRFTCNGRLISVGASMRGSGNLLNRGTNLPMIQIWRPSPGLSSYSRVGQVPTPGGTFIATGLFQGYYLANISLTVSEQIKFQSGDVIGYYQPTDPQRRISSIDTSGFISYSNNANDPETTIDINNVDNTHDQQQPLIEAMFGKSSQHIYRFIY